MGLPGSFLLYTHHTLYISRCQGCHFYCFDVHPKTRHRGSMVSDNLVSQGRATLATAVWSRQILRSRPACLKRSYCIEWPFSALEEWLVHPYSSPQWRGPHGIANDWNTNTACWAWTCHKGTGIELNPQPHSFLGKAAICVHQIPHLHTGTKDTNKGWLLWYRGKNAACDTAFLIKCLGFRVHFTSNTSFLLMQIIVAAGDGSSPCHQQW